MLIRIDCGMKIMFYLSVKIPKITIIAHPSELLSFFLNNLGLFPIVNYFVMVLFNVCTPHHDVLDKSKHKI